MSLKQETEFKVAEVALEVVEAVVMAVVELDETLVQLALTKTRETMKLKNHLHPLAEENTGLKTQNGARFGCGAYWGGGRAGRN